MIGNYVKTAFRNFKKHKTFTFLNVMGLALGTAASLLILQYVKYERSFDTFNSKAKDIYRIQYNGYHNGKLDFECAAAVPAVGPALKNNFAEVNYFTRLYPVSGIISYEGPNGLVAFREEKMQIADTSLFKVFDFHLIKGNPATCLKGTDKAVISERAAKRYFGDVDPVGKTIAWDGNRKFEVTGILENVPSNSHIKFDFLFSYETLNRDTKNNSETAWGWYDFNTYVLLKSGTDIHALQSKWDAYLKETRSENWKKYNFYQEFIFQPLLSIHLYSKLLQESQT
ncbi:MAG: ABC transporter permease [Cyclobacteriaceae bacterium]